MIVGNSLYGEIRHLYNAGESQRAIAKRSGVSRQTVKKYCEGKTLPGIRKSYSRARSVITEEVMAFIEACLDEDRKLGLRKQKHTAKRIYERLVTECAYAGSYTSVRRVIHSMNERYVPAQADMPLVHRPGDTIQIDWGQATICLNGEKVVVQTFCGRLCYSCDIFVMAFLNQNRESFLEALQCMLKHFNGVPREILFDNAKVAVKEGWGRHAIAQDYYQAFAAHYDFVPKFCNPARGNEKGLVENLVGFSRRNFFVPVPKVKSMKELNELLLKGCLTYRQTHRVDGRSKTVAEMFETDRKSLHALPPYPYDTSHTEVVRVGDSSTVRFEKNEYSVPIRFLRQQVTVKGYANEVFILCDTKTKVCHERLIGSGDVAYRLEHYIPLLERQPRCVFQSKPVINTVPKELLCIGSKLPGGNKEMVRLLRLYVDYGGDRLMEAIHRIPIGVTVTIDLIRSNLLPPATIPQSITCNDVQVQEPDLSYYDCKCKVMTQ